MSTVLFLGASWFQLPPIIYAKRAGHRVVTCDNRPDNPGHALADVHLDVSTVDEDAVLAHARAERIDGVVCYASDVSAPSAARVAEALGLAGNPYQAITTLTDKQAFREHQQRLGLAAPGFCASGRLDALQRGARRLRPPLLVKPVDSSGSRGISLIHDLDGLAEAFQTARATSRRRAVVVEEVVRKAGPQLTGDGFLVDGRLAFSAFTNEHFSAGGKSYHPVGESLPAAFEPSVLGRIHDAIQNLVTGLGMTTGALNFDIILDDRGCVHLIEIGPRCGGNGLPVLIRHATGVDLARATVEAALGNPAPLRAEGAVRPHGSYNVVDLLAAHDVPPERPVTLLLAPELRERIIYQRFQLRCGELLAPEDAPAASVGPLRPAELAVGFLLLRFQHAAEMLQTMEGMHDLLRIVD